MISARASEAILQCQECSRDATLIAVVPGEDGRPAHHVFKCGHCGYFNWIDESSPRSGGMSNRAAVFHTPH